MAPAVRNALAPVAVARWRFVPHRASETSAAEEAAFRLALPAAVRSGHGLGVRLAFVLTSGPSASLFLEALDPPSARWAARTVPLVYGPGHWVEAPPPLSTGAGPPGRCVWGPARRCFDWPEPLSSPDPAPPLADLAALVLRAAPPGFRLRWAWEPIPPPRHRWWHTPPAAPGPAPPSDRTRLPGSRAAAPAASFGPLERPLLGRLAVTVDGPKAGDSNGAPTVLAAVEAAVRSPRGNGLDLGRRPRSGRFPFLGRPTGLLATVGEWAAWWPSRRAGVAPGIAPPADRSFWPLGRTALGEVVGPPVESHQGRHLAVLGETGMGKSSLLVALARRVFEAGGGVVFDPVGDTVAAIRAALPPGGLRRLRSIAPGPEPLTLNALDGAGPGTGADPEAGERRLRDLVFAFRRVRSAQYETAEYWGPRLDEMLTRALRAAAALPRGTLTEAHLLLETGGRLGRAVPPEAAGPITDLAHRMQDHPDDAEGARRLLHEVVGSPTLSRMLCAPEPTVRIGPLVGPGEIVLLSGEAARVGEATARRLLAIYLGLVWSELLARPGASKTVVMLDEAQWFAHDSLSEMLKLGRKRNVHVVLATQSIASFRHPSVEESVRTNVADLVVFRGSPREARDLEQTIPSVRAETLLALPRGRALLLLGKGEQVHWIRTARSPEPGPRPLFGEVAPGRPTPRSTAPEKAGGSALPSPEGATVAVPPPAAFEAAPSARAAPGRDPALDRVVATLLARLDAAGPSSLAVPLAELRAGADPSGEAIRRVGSRLGREGVCAREVGPDGGSCWRLDPRAAAVLRTAFPGAAGGDAVAAQPS